MQGIMALYLVWVYEKHPDMGGMPNTLTLMEANDLQKIVAATFDTKALLQ